MRLACTIAGDSKPEEVEWSQKDQIWKTKDEKSEEQDNPFARKRRHLDKKENLEVQDNPFAKKMKEEPNGATHENPIQRSQRDAVWKNLEIDEKTKDFTPLEQAKAKAINEPRGTEALVKAIHTGNIPLPPVFTALTSTTSNAASVSTPTDAASVSTPNSEPAAGSSCVCAQVPTQRRPPIMRSQRSGTIQTKRKLSEH